MKEPSYIAKFEAMLNFAKFSIEPADDVMTPLLLHMLLKVDVDYIYRVKVVDADRVQFSQLELPRETEPVNEIIPNSQLPEWVDELVCVLSVCDVGTIIPEVGVRAEPDVYYLCKKNLVV